jgi:hypothetical protein
MDEHRIPQRLLEMKVSGRRPHGRPLTQWTDQVKRGVERKGWDWRTVDEMQEWADSTGDSYANVNPQMWKQHMEDEGWYWVCPMCNNDMKLAQSSKRRDGLWQCIFTWCLWVITVLDSKVQTDRLRTEIWAKVTWCNEQRGSQVAILQSPSTCNAEHYSLVGFSHTTALLNFQLYKKNGTVIVIYRGTYPAILLNVP